MGWGPPSRWVPKRPTNWYDKIRRRNPFHRHGVLGAGQRIGALQAF